MGWGSLNMNVQWLEWPAAERPVLILIGSHHICLDAMIEKCADAAMNCAERRRKVFSYSTIDDD
jgi:hypothetical protein